MLKVFCIIGFAISTLAVSAKTFDISVLGSIHKEHLNKKFGYNLTNLKHQIEEMKSELVCGEISEKHYGTRMEGYYPPEAVLVDYVSNKIGAKFYPADWRGYYPDQVKANKKLTAKERAIILELRKIVFSSFPSRPEEFFDFFHSKHLALLIKNVHDAVIHYGTEVADGYSLARNQMIVVNCLRKARELKAKRVLFVFGVDHKYILEEILGRYPEVIVQPVVKEFKA